MVLAGKKFKDIYDSGVKALSDTEAQSIAEMKAAKENHSGAHKKSTKQSVKQLEEKSSLLQSELKQSIDQSLKKMENTVATENAQSEAFVSSLVSELKMLTQQMKLKLEALKQSHNENVDFARTVAAERYLTSTEESSFELEQELSTAIDEIGSQGTTNLDGLQKNTEKLLLQVVDDVDEIAKSNLISSKTQIQTIVDHFNSLSKVMSVDSQNRLKGLETSARNASQEVESSARSLLEIIANHATTIEKEINLNYDQITTSHYRNADNRLSNCADELSTLHDTTTEELINHTDQLSEDLLFKSTQVQQGLQNRCDDVVRGVETSFEDFKNNLDERLEYSRGQKQTLEGDKNKLLVAVQSELVSIQKSFGKKVAAVFDQSKLDLTAMTTSIEEEIVTAIESLDLQMNASAQSIQKKIEDEVAKFLRELSTSRTDAIAEIMGAAKGNLPDSKINQSRQDNESELEGDSQLEEEAQTQNPIEETGLSENETRRNRRRKDIRE